MSVEVDRQDVSRYGEMLSDDGIVIIEDYLDSEKCDRYRDAIMEHIEDGTIEEAPSGSGYSELASADRSLLNRREGDYDGGMVDVFNIDRTIDELREIKDDPFITGVINWASSDDVAPNNLNVYLNRSVTKTRTYHADSYREQYKSFIYLTDVPDQSYGPFSYIRGTHDLSSLVRTGSSIYNRLKGDPPTDAVVYDDDSIEIVTASRGALIIADQRGYHRGIPQEEGKERLLLTTSFVPK